jgi:DNA primase catalytic core
MSRRIPQTFIHELVARANLLDVIGARVTLKKAGANYKGLCPFHNEKTPSFSVSPDKGFYHCFGCGVHGNAIDFVMRYENRSFVEAVEALADMLHLEVPRDGNAEPENEFDSLYALLREADLSARAPRPWRRRRLPQESRHRRQHRSALRARLRARRVGYTRAGARRNRGCAQEARCSGSRQRA